MLILILIYVQYLQNAFFSFEKGSNCQNHSSSGSHHPVKKFPQQNFWFHLLRGNLPPPLHTHTQPYHYLENPHHFYFYHQVFIQAILMSVIRHKKLKLIIEFSNSIFIYIWVQLNGSCFMIHDEVLNFHDWIFCYRKHFTKNLKKDKNYWDYQWMDLWYLNNMKVISILWTLNYVDCVPFSCIDSFHIVHNWAN